MIDDAPPEVQPLRRAQICSTIAQTIILLETYKDFEDVFLVKNAGHLSPQKNHDHAIDLVDGKQPLYGLIYNLSENKLFILWAYINKHLVYRFIGPSKSPVDALILFVPKFNGGFWLCVDYQGLNNITIENRFPLFLVSESLDRLGRAKQFIKLHFTDTYYRICTKKSDEWKTVFWTWYSHYKYCVIFFGPANTLVTFQSYINKCVAEKQEIFFILYLNDIFIYINKKRAKHEEIVR